MPPIVSKIKHKKLHGQAREIVFRVLEFCEEEARLGNGGNLLIPIKQCQKRCSRATGVSLDSVKKIKKEGKAMVNGQVFATPNKTRVKKKPVTVLDDFDKTLIRRTVHSFYSQEKSLPTVGKLRAKLQDIMNFTGGNTSLRKILKELGFKWRKTSNNRKLLIERDDIRNKRINFIRQIRRYRSEHRPIIYTDETYVCTTHSTPKSWQDDTSEGLHTPVSGGDRLIIVNAGGSSGFVPGAFLQWKASQSTGDYHENMNQTNYEKWIKEKLIPNLQPRSVIVVDNAAYHNVKVDKVPTKSSTKTVMQEWLTKHNIAFTADMLKVELFQLITLNKPEERYRMDNIIESAGHTVLRLPPYHPDLNAIELIWSQLKSYVAAHNTTFTMTGIMSLVQNKSETIGITEWEKAVDHVIKIENQYVEREGILDEIVDRIVVNLDESDSENSESEDELDMSGIEQL